MPKHQVENLKVILLNRLYSSMKYFDYICYFIAKGKSLTNLKTLPQTLHFNSILHISEGKKENIGFYTIFVGNTHLNSYACMFF